MTMNNMPIMNSEELMAEIEKTPLIWDPDHRGTSVEDAIVILGTKKTQLGIVYEHAYLDTMFPGYILEKQSLIKKDDKAYDIIEIKKESNKYQIYFDITAFYGKEASHQNSRCVCNDSDCAKCLLVNCNDDNCIVHTKIKKEQFRENYKNR